MNENDLIEYLSMVADMENNIYLQKTLIEKLKTLSSGYGLSKAVIEPAKPSAENVNSKDYIAGYCGILISIVIGVIICYFGLKLLFSPSNTLGDIIVSFFGGLIVTMIGGGFVLCGLVFIPEAVNAHLSEKENEYQYENDMIKYDENMAQYQQDLLEDKTRIEKELNEKRFVDSEINSVEKRLAESQMRLNYMYNFGVIYPKYRNMVMVNSICEYLKSGRCNTLEGPNGAYNILENEMRLDRIILQLDQVIEKLDRIMANQYMLYSAIQTVNNSVRELTESTKEIAAKIDGLQIKEQDYTKQIQELQATSNIAVYNLERVNKELHYMNRMKYYVGEYSGTFFNRLP